MAVTRNWHPMIPDIRIALFNYIGVDVWVLWASDPVALSSHTFTLDHHDLGCCYDLAIMICRIA